MFDEELARMCEVLNPRCDKANASGTNGEWSLDLMLMAQRVLNPEDAGDGLAS